MLQESEFLFVSRVFEIQTREASPISGKNANGPRQRHASESDKGAQPTAQQNDRMQQNC
jgi:hypothetical protein